MNTKDWFKTPSGKATHGNLELAYHQVDKAYRAETLSEMEEHASEAIKALRRVVNAARYAQRQEEGN